MVDDCSACTEMMSAPALAKSGMSSSGWTIICRGRRARGGGLGWARAPGRRVSAAALARLAAPCSRRHGTHQVAVQGLVGHGAQGIDNQRADGDVGHEAPVHHVDVDPVAPGIINGLDLRRGAAQGRWAPGPNLGRGAARATAQGRRVSCSPAHLLAKTGEIGREDGRANLRAERARKSRSPQRGPGPACPSPSCRALPALWW